MSRFVVLSKHTFDCCRERSTDEVLSAADGLRRGSRTRWKGLESSGRGVRPSCLWSTQIAIGCWNWRLQSIIPVAGDQIAAGAGRAWAETRWSPSGIGLGSACNNFGRFDRRSNASECFRFTNSVSIYTSILRMNVLFLRILLLLLLFCFETQKVKSVR